MSLSGTKLLIGSRGKPIPVPDTTHEHVAFATGNLGKDYNLLMDYAEQHKFDWVVTGSHHVINGTMTKFPTTPISMLQVRMGQDDGRFSAPEDASVWVIHRSAFGLRHSELFPCYWEDFHLVYNVWWDLAYSANPSDCGLTSLHPFHPKHDESLVTELSGRFQFKRLFRQKHHCEFSRVPPFDVWRSKKPRRLADLLAA